MPRLAAVGALALLAGNALAALPSFNSPFTHHSSSSSYGDNLKGPQLASDGLGNWVLVMATNKNELATGTDSDIFVSRSSDDGKSWTQPAPYHAIATTDAQFHFDQDPRIATDNKGTWVIVWRATILPQTYGNDYDIFVSRSTDNGATWSPPAALEPYAATDSGVHEPNYDVVFSKDTWFVVYQTSQDVDESDGDHDLIQAKSTDGGQTWTGHTVLIPYFRTDTGGDFVPQLAADGEGTLVASWISNNSFGNTGGDQDIFCARTTDNGETWTGPVVVNHYATIDDPWEDSAPTPIVTDGNGNWLMIWAAGYRLIPHNGYGSDIAGALSQNAGSSWTNSTPLSPPQWSTNSDWDYRPSVATDGHGAWAAVWESNFNEQTTGTDSEILLVSTTTPQGPWAAAVTINDDATTDTMRDYRPHIVANRRSGAWVTTFWRRNPTLVDVMLAVDPDEVPPGLALHSPAATETATFIVQALFTEPVRGFDSNDIIATNATVEGFTGEHDAFSWTARPQAFGEVTFTIPAGAAHDPSGNENTTQTLTVVYRPKSDVWTVK